MGEEEGEAVGRLILPWISRIASPPGVLSICGSGLVRDLSVVWAGEV